MSSTDVFFGIQDFLYWTFESILEPLGDMPWMLSLLGGFVGFGYWMYRQHLYNKAAEADPNQIK